MARCTLGLGPCLVYTATTIVHSMDPIFKTLIHRKGVIWSSGLGKSSISAEIYMCH